MLVFGDRIKSSIQHRVSSIQICLYLKSPSVHFTKKGAKKTAFFNAVSVTTKGKLLAKRKAKYLAPQFIAGFLTGCSALLHSAFHFMPLSL
jgi:hypothetical protein